MSTDKMPASTKFIPQEKPHPGGIPHASDINPVVPDHVRAIIGDLFIEWGKVDAKMIWFAHDIVYGEKSPGIAELEKQGRFRILKDLIRYERDTYKGENSYFKLLLADNILAPKVRNTIAHGITLGVTNLDGGSLTVMKSSKDGRVVHYSFPFGAIEKARDLTRFVSDALDEYVKAYFKFLARTDAERAAASPAGE